MSAAGAETGPAAIGAEPAPLLTVRVERKVYRRPGRRARTEAVEAVRGLAFELHAGEITCLIGPSGAGKTTTLRILLGLDRDFEGSVSPEPSRAGIAMVFQDPRLLPWRTIEQNVRLGLPRARRGRDLDDLFESLGLTSWRAHYPGALSLGMQRRVALARALALEPRILVLDEPFVSLDDAAAASLRALVVGAVGRTGTSVLMVTHNVAEAIEIADRLLLVSPRPAHLLANIPLERLRAERDRAWADTTRRSLAARFPAIVAL
ncbi:ATP-binding cassette domain-containing protein [Methylorubrum rhodesianum]|jgi:NitT/TauT family transport system ATP-binding protein|uniref:ATP-binding cassette domain-containing protein n=1 Tax=Methylorubrum rhodesianum TaxID=29427 RepID=A0ABU9ZA31_9HYPH|nr:MULTISPECIES: ATP-binding cassette domain-containing protein [Methylorubrum]MBB5763067.1 NitT/TauT family transport system ATP-binding protein [Methylorubrum rhodesianum]MBI1689202.1 ATP-binding cassette domain-containing protein [Methylorubrum sp. DB1722]MBK3403341.1 ATP-binding cassette domain-containing protein [Methylorubrum rhodesianum]MBY0139699.1 ATP-binding cassette domain-containing protein [Methylorubrum populi]